MARKPAVSSAAPEPSPAATGLEAAMASVGDRWTLVVIDALLSGSRRFSDLQGAIPRVAPNVLTARLRSLEEGGLVVGVRYSDRPPRSEYSVTEAGRELAGALRLLSRWGSRQSGGDVYIDVPHHRSCGTALEAQWYCPTCARVTENADDGLYWL